MIIIDLNQVMISNFMAQIGNHTNVEVEEGLLRHMILNSIRGYMQKFKSEYGDVVIACDDRKYWRREVFPYYKANRKKNREQSEIDWTAVFESLNTIRDELKTFFPYRVIQAEGAEADDVIGTLVQEFGDTNEKILILSGDKDFVQLQTYMNVKQYDPTRKRWIQHNDPSRFVKEHILRGDAGDGVPNFLSPDNCFVVGERQKPIMQKKLDTWVSQNPEEFCDSKMLRNYHRNKQLIDLSCTPAEVRERVLAQYAEQNGKDRKELFNYFIDKKLKHLLESINEF